jgi:hypothetical protein
VPLMTQAQLLQSAKKILNSGAAPAKKRKPKKAAVEGAGPKTTPKKRKPAAKGAADWKVGYLVSNSVTNAPLEIYETQMGAQLACAMGPQLKITAVKVVHE